MISLNCDFSIQNIGQFIERTDYWKTDLARKGFCLLSENYGALRLLLPKACKHWEKEILTGKSVALEASLSIAGNLDVVFDDGTRCPFFISVSPNLIDVSTNFPRGKSDFPLAVWTEEGLLRTFIGTLRPVTEWRP